MTASRFSFSKHLRYRLEGWIGKTLLMMCRLLPLQTASSFGKCLGQLLGPYHKASQVAANNLLRIFPSYSDKQRAQILRDMWGNLARIPMEYAHIKAFLKPQEQWRIQIQGMDVLEKVREDNKPAILFSAHLGNWQMITLAGRLHGLDLIQLYRPANNPWADKVMRDFQLEITDGVITKGPQGARAMIAALQKGKHVLILADQKMNDGISVPFLGHQAMTAPAVARLAQKFQCPLVPVRVERLVGASFQVTFCQPLSLEGSEYDIMKRVNDLLGEWVSARPEQWFWVHNRWPTINKRDKES